MNNRRTGYDQETRAIEYLEKKGYRIIARNELNRFGEIDIICLSPDGCIVFAEVKYRRDGDRGDPLEAVDERKIRKICKASAFYLGGHAKYSDFQVRYDVLGVEDDKEIRHIENAFDYVG
ncbi:MAG: YraN family protein [Lachnospiraceae bacterium]|nr:YraN family protein [Lachnospiraceae bacterium]